VKQTAQGTSYFVLFIRYYEGDEMGGACSTLQEWKMCKR